MKFNEKFYAAMGAVTALALTSPAVMAAGGGASALSAGVQAVADEGKAELWILGGIVVGVCIIGFLIGRAKRQAS